MELPSYFSRYLSKIQPSRTSRQLATQLHTTLRDRLKSDEDFGKLHVESFVYGSYRRNTAIKQIKDVDVCIVLDIDTATNTPKQVVNKLRAALERLGYKDKTALQRRSVRIDMSKTTVDVVPVVDVTESLGYYLIPDRKLEEWVPTYPKHHLEAVSKRNAACNRRFVPLAKAVKAWYKFQAQGIERPKPKGFTLEALLLQHQDQDAPSYAEAFVAFLEKIDSTYGAQLSEGKFPDIADPAGTGGILKLNISGEKAKRFGKIVKESIAEAKIAMTEETTAAAANSWRKIFGADFPQAPQLIQESKSSSDELEPDFDDVSEDELSEVELSESEQPQKPWGLTDSPNIQVLKITAKFGNNQYSTITWPYKSGSKPLSKKSWVTFTVHLGTIERYSEVVWIVKNHGSEASRANDLGHTNEGQSLTTQRSTAYRGSHSMICELREDGVVLGRGRFVVNVAR